MRERLDRYMEVEANRLRVAVRILIAVVTVDIIVAVLVFL